MKIYIASRFTPNRTIVAEMSRQLAAVGIECTQTWPNEAPTCNPLSAVTRDLREIFDADALLLYTVGCEQVPGGMHFEAGYAYGIGKKFFLIGPKVNIFCNLATEYESLDDFIGDPR